MSSSLKLLPEPQPSGAHAIGKYWCRICGKESGKARTLCDPGEGRNTRFCGSNALQVCKEQRGSMMYSCDACNSVSADPTHLCSPRRRG